MSKSICVYCASSDAVSPAFFQVANDLGALIAKNGYTLVYGGGNNGLMGALAISTHKHGGRVVGVIPKFLRDFGVAYEESNELIVTADMRERKAIMESRADAFIGLPGGFGTLEEMFEIINRKQLRLHAKPIVFLNTDGFYDGLRDVFEHMYNEQFAKPHCRQLYCFTPDASSAISCIQDYEPPVLDVKWF